jgi:excinuclease ABC subunit B
MYADKMTDSMKKAIDETNRRRAVQVAFNQAHGIEPVSIIKAVRDLTDSLSARGVAEARGEYKAGKPETMPRGELKRLITELEAQMKEAAKNLEFEKAAVLRDQVYELRGLLAEETHAPPWERIKYLSGES